MRELLLVCLGGAVGSGCRYLMTAAAVRALGPGFPYGTVAVNLLGSFCLSIIMVLGIEKGALSPAVRLTLGAGVMGGFTTYSSFNFETLRLLQSGAVGAAALNVAVTLVGCLGAGALGMWAALRLL